MESPELYHYEPLEPKPGCLVFRFVPCNGGADDDLPENTTFEFVYKMYDPEDKADWSENAAERETKVVGVADTVKVDGGKGLREALVAGLQPTSTFRVKVRQSDKSAEGGFTPWSEEVLYDTPVGSCGPEGGESDSGMGCVVV